MFCPGEEGDIRPDTEKPQMDPSVERAEREGEESAALQTQLLFRVY